jgi:hypothetical protein
METFDFAKTDNKYLYNISSNMLLHIKRINHNVAILYFTDEMNNKINVPDDIVVYTNDYQNSNKIIIEKLFSFTQDYYPLCWTDKNKKILSLNNQRKWDIVASKYAF